MTTPSSKEIQVQTALADRSRIAAQGGITVGQLMTGKPVEIRPYMGLTELIRMFHEKGFRHFLVTDGESRLLGVISDRDVLGTGELANTHAQGSPSRLTAADIMSSQVITVGPATPLDEAVTLMLDYGISCLPVIVEGSVIGILTNSDLQHLLRQVLQILPQLLAAESVQESA